MIILCEDLQHATFFRRLLIDLGYPRRRIRVKQCPDGEGAGDQYVLNHYPSEVSEHRKNSARINIGLLTVIDADELKVQRRHRQLNQELDREGLEPRSQGEKVCLAVPKRNIETWIYSLFGHEVNETETYAKLDKEGDCQPAVDELVQFVRTDCPDDLIPSLRRGCQELSNRLPG
jgi:hypothetical protein